MNATTNGTPKETPNGAPNGAPNGTPKETSNGAPNGAPKDKLLAALRRESADSPAWVPFAGVHAGKLVGKTAKETLTQEDALFDALMAVNRIYRPHGQPIMFDLQIEAEILGCELQWGDDSPPTVKSHPLADTMSVPCRCTLPKPADGRLPIALGAMRRMKRAVGDTTALFGLFCGPLTLALHLRGTDLFLDMYDDEEYVAELLDYCTDAGLAVADMYIDAGMDVVAAVDPLVSQISARHFEAFLSKPYESIFLHMRERGTLSSFFVCGDASRNIESMCRTKPDSVFVDENVDLPAAKRVTDAYGIAIGGNIPLSSVMLHGSQRECMRCTLDLIDRVEDKRGLIVAPGCDMPYDTPVENAVGVAEAVLETEKVREMLGRFDAIDTVSCMEPAAIAMPDYARLSRPIIEVFTLDADTCAACTYMWRAALAAANRFGGAVDVVERRSTIKENIARAKRMGVRNLPSIYINGELRFSSLIPSSEKLDEAIKEAIKGRSPWRE